MKSKTLRSALAVGAGWLVFLSVSFATGVAWGRYSEGHYPNAVMLASMLGAIVAGYVAALVSGQAQMSHALCLAAVIIGWNLVVRVIDLHQQTEHTTWLRWVVGVVNVMTWIVGGALLRYWQITRRVHTDQT